MKAKQLSALESLEKAQEIAFAPFVFQATVSLKELGILDYIFSHRKNGNTTIPEISKALNISEYGIGVLLEIAESSDIVIKNEQNQYEITKIGYFLNAHETVNVNLNFTNDVCYKGLFHLKDSIINGKPEGLKEFGNWNTIYEGLSVLPKKVATSWFEFDHHYSDAAFDEALKIVLKNNPKTIYDVGGNTGKFAIAACKANKAVKVTMFDLRGQLNIALKNIKEEGFVNRVNGFEIDWLAKEQVEIPKGADTIWMSQFLDCFSYEEILSILTRLTTSMNENTELLIMETFTDRQQFDNAKFSLEATSLYFTVFANGNSKMYPAKVFIELIDKAGLKLIDDLKAGEYHTILKCKKK